MKGKDPDDFAAFANDGDRHVTAREMNGFGKASGKKRRRKLHPRRSQLIPSNQLTDIQPIERNDLHVPVGGSPVRTRNDGNIGRNLEVSRMARGSVLEHLFTREKGKESSLAAT